MKILIADDDPQVLRALRITLGARGYDILTATDGASAINLAIEHRPELYMLDLGMPKLDGIDVIHALRGWTDAPILVVSGRSGSAEKVEALDAGADDYVTKPFAIDELLARLRALTRRAPGEQASPVVAFGDIVVNVPAKTVVRQSDQGDESIRLTPTEWRILEALLQRPDQLVTRQELLDVVWGPTHSTDTGYLRLYLSQLRKKLEPQPSHPRHLLTEAGLGYRFSPNGTTAVNQPSS